MEKEKIKLTIDEANQLVFGVEISGIDNVTVDPRFVIELSGMNLEFPGTYNDGEVTVDIPILTKILDADTYTAKLELVLEENRFFVPLEVEVDLVLPIKVHAAVSSKVLRKKYSSVTENSLEANPANSNEIKIKGKLVKTKTLDDLIAEEIDHLAKAKNVNELLFSYSKHILLRESYLPLNIQDIMPKLNEVSQKLFNKNFTEYTKQLKVKDDQ